MKWVGALTIEPRFRINQPANKNDSKGGSEHPDMRNDF
jgi:hypothetical protein